MGHEFKLFECMSYTFSSHLTHKIKPDSCAFQHVLDTLNIEPKKVLFFDDNQANVEAANALGIISVQVNGVNELKTQLLLYLGTCTE
jgi:HAD superfamily hydrolase (TIGR01509 family)